MTERKKLIGAIFDTGAGSYRYFLGRYCGGTGNKCDAFVYSCAEIREYMLANKYWASKVQGKWILVYE